MLPKDGRYGRFKDMNLKENFLEYPLVIKKVYNYVTISIPDLGISRKIPLPLTPQEQVSSSLFEKNSVFKMMFLKEIEEVYTEAERHLAQKKWKPAPSTIKNQLTPNIKSYSLPEFRKLISCHYNLSENTLRREIERGRIIAHKTEGGHRRIPHSEFVRYLETLTKAKDL